ncbi:NADPH-dependent FMN reductase [Actinacidiphila yeochonensis]|uniref:NADPH-dependent FMN reductase n=1 Tax=Actinacidiphila yeochonensis TaxID=89050 RepID=UPI00055BDDF4|nr:NAD(P)H-dependent oxidoreductase [Actinacidiphila yeochonensis]
MSVVVLSGNPRSGSRTLKAALGVAEELTGGRPDHVVELSELGPALLTPGDPGVAEAAAAVTGASLLVVASPTFKASYTGLLKLFLDGLDHGALTGVTAVPLMLGAHWRHGLAADLLLKPVLVELGATVPTRGLFLLDSEYADSPELTAWLPPARRQVAAAVDALAERTAP